MQPYGIFVHFQKSRIINSEGRISSQVQQCCEYIQLHVEDKITVDQLAQQVGHAKNYLIKKFHKETGKTIGAYITEAKMERAKLLLKEPGKSVQDVAEQLGYATQSHFGELFRKHMPSRSTLTWCAAPGVVVSVGLP